MAAHTQSHRARGSGFGGNRVDPLPANRTFLSASAISVLLLA